MIGIESRPVLAFSLCLGLFVSACGDGEGPPVTSPSEATEGATGTTLFDPTGQVDAGEVVEFSEQYTEDAAEDGDYFMVAADFGEDEESGFSYRGQSPIIYAGEGAAIVGSGVLGLESVRFDQGQQTGSFNDVMIFTQQDTGIGLNSLSSYLYLDAEDQDNEVYAEPFPKKGTIRRWGDSPPTVHVAHGTSVEHIAEAETAVRLINNALPQSWQLQFSSTSVPIPTKEELLRGTNNIVVAFAPIPAELRGSDFVLGVAETSYTLGNEIKGARIWVDTDIRTQQERLEVLAHEMLHALGRKHIEGGLFNTLMSPYGSSDPDYWRAHAYVLPQLDNEALLAVYSRLQPGIERHHIKSEIESYGPWETESTELTGIQYLLPEGKPASEAVFSDLTGLAIFGAQYRNGKVRPYASAVILPEITLAENQRILDSNAIWSGRLAGLTQRAEPVAGAAEMTLNVGTLRGVLNFSDMEYWNSKEPPGDIGSGARWQDGDLQYRIGVSENEFFSDGGDSGRVEGVFFGSGHEGMTGTVSREDMAAGFAGARAGHRGEER